MNKCWNNEHYAMVLLGGLEHLPVENEEHYTTILVAKE